jgi:thioredoxin-like negative regulator of GroEL
MQSIEDIQKIIDTNEAVVLYFSAESCNVCHALRPKLFDAIEKNFDKFKIVSIDISQEQDIAINFGIFTIPTLLVFLEGREFLRKSRYMSVDEVIGEIKRPYEMMIS